MKFKGFPWRRLKGAPRESGEARAGDTDRNAGIPTDQPQLQAEQPSKGSLQFMIVHVKNIGLTLYRGSPSWKGVGEAEFESCLAKYLCSQRKPNEPWFPAWGEYIQKHD
jgi:hypothetical protein